MTKSLPRDWAIHGSFAQTLLLAGVLPHGGVHFLTGPQGHEREALVADVAVAIASDAVTCGLSAPDKNGARSSLSGFFGQLTGHSTGVAIITDAKRADSLSRAIAASSLARGVSRGLPIAVLGGYSAEASGFRLHELNEWFGREHGVDLGLIVLDGLALPQSEVNAFQRPDRAVLSVCEFAPAGVGAESVILEIGEGRVTAAKTASGEPWAREFGLDAVSVAGVETLVLAPGKAVEPAPIWKAAPVVAGAPVAKEPELPIVSRVALVVSRGEITPKLRLRLAAEGYEVVQSQEAALPKPGEIEGGKRQIIVAGEDQLPTELKARATRLNDEAVRRGVSDVVTIQVAA